MKFSCRMVSVTGGTETMFPKKGTALPVRLTEEEKNQLLRIAQETGLTVSTLIRLLISSLIAHYRENGNMFSLPLQWKSIVASSHKPMKRLRESESTEKNPGRLWRSPPG